MKISTNIALAGLILAGLPACTTAGPNEVRPEAVTLGAGNAQAANTVLQMVDPWPAGVDDTNIKTPADLEQYKPEQSEDDAADGVATSDIAGQN